MTNTSIRSALFTILLIVIVPAGLLTLCTTRAIGCTTNTASQLESGSANTQSPSCTPYFSPRLGVGIGEIHGQIRYGRRPQTADSGLPACEDDFSHQLRLNWVIGKTTIWSIEI